MLLLTFKALNSLTMKHISVDLVCALSTIKICG